MRSKASSSPQSQQLTTQDSLRIATAENKTLETILHSIQSIDTARQNELIQWIITDRTIRSRVISALRKENYHIAPNSVAEMTVTQKPPVNDNDMQLLRIVIEQVGIYGEPNIRRVLGSVLYDEINSRTGYEFTLISTQQEQEKIQFIGINASLFGGDILFKSGFGFGINLGDDYIGYPFWLPATIGTYGILDENGTNFRLGVEWPLGESGVTPFTISQGLQIRGSKLVGAMAFDAEIKQDLGVLQEQSGKLGIGVEFRNAFTPSVTSFPAFALSGLSTGQDPYATGLGGKGTLSAKDSLYYLKLSAHAYVTYQFPNQSLRGAYVELGGGLHIIQPVTIGTPPIDPEQSEYESRTHERFRNHILRSLYQDRLYSYRRIGSGIWLERAVFEHAAHRCVGAALLMAPNRSEVFDDRWPQSVSVGIQGLRDGLAEADT